MRPITGFSAACLLVTLISSSLAQDSEVPRKPSLVPAVTVVDATMREMVETVVVTGTFVPRDEILVAAEIDGYRLTEVLVEEGMRVTRGQVLARLSRDLIERQIAQQNAMIDKAKAAVPQAENNIVQAEAAETEARLGFQRAQQLMQSGNTTAVVLEGRVSALRQAEGRLAFARNGLAMAKADLAQAHAVSDELDLRLARTEIRAPEAGIVSRRTARIGMTASSSGEPLFRLIARGEIELEGEVIEVKLPLISEGKPAWIEIGHGERIEGTVRAVYPEVDRTSRLGKVRIRLPTDDRLRIGSFAKGTIEIARSRGISVPQSAVLYGGAAGASVLVVKDGKVQMRQVITGLSDDNNIELLSGVSAGEAVVLRAGSFLRDGDPVRAVPVSQSPASRERSAESAMR